MKNLKNYKVQELSSKEVKKTFGGGNGVWGTLLGNIVGVALMTFPPTAVAINGYNLYNEYNS